MHPAYEKITDKGRKVLKMANDFANENNHLCVTPLHILWGIIVEDSNIGRKILKNLKVNLNQLKSEIERLLGKDSYRSHERVVPYGREAAQCIIEAIDVGYSINHVGCHHLLLGILSMKDNAAAELLKKKNVTVELVWAEIDAAVKPVVSS